jgi:sugar fermentation stimulation protein A
MEFPQPLVPARLIRRYKRFLADVALADGTTTTVHCPNPGSMLGLDEPGSEIWLSPARSPGRKLPYTWELIRIDSGLVGINTGHPNALAEEAIRNGRIEELAGYAGLRREVAYGRSSRIDILLDGDRRPACYVEVKNVHLKRTDAAEFPDCVTARGAKHLDELAAMARAGFRAVMLFVVQRTDCRRFAIAADIDPAYGAALARAMAAGVEAISYVCAIERTGIGIAGPIPLDIPSITP